MRNPINDPKQSETNSIAADPFPSAKIPFSPFMDASKMGARQIVSP
jgi:hypothetical protein